MEILFLYFNIPKSNVTKQFYRTFSWSFLYIFICNWIKRKVENVQQVCYFHIYKYWIARKVRRITKTVSLSSTVVSISTASNISHDHSVTEQNNKEPARWFSGLRSLSSTRNGVMVGSSIKFTHRVM